MTNDSTSVNILPGVNMLSLLARMDYKTWFALAEFVDNSIQSYLDYQQKLEETEGLGFRLKVDIEFDSDLNQIVIRDNAAGIHKTDYQRAFRPAEVPPDTTGLSEFGMGMKSAACWFAPRWTVRTSALGEPTEAAIEFNIEKIVNDHIEELPINIIDSTTARHFTEITLIDVFEKRMPKTATIAKIRDHLKSIFRVFLKSGLVELRVAGESLSWDEPPILSAAFCRDPEGDEIYWRKDIDFDLGCGQIVTGFAAIQENSNPNRAGFALFRRNRVIQGSADEPYRPNEIFGSPTSLRSKRIFGELHLEGFEVRHTKNGFIWDDVEEVFIDLLKTELDKAPKCLLTQAEGYKCATAIDVARSVSDVSNTTTDAMQKTLAKTMEMLVDSEQTEASQRLEQVEISVPALASREVKIELPDATWLVTLEFSTDDSVGDWLSVSDQKVGDDVELRHHISLRLALAHPFMNQLVRCDDPQALEPVVRLATAIAIAEIAARNAGISKAGVIRRNINKLLRECLSAP